jgi:hypothetical protein
MMISEKKPPTDWALQARGAFAVWIAVFFAMLFVVELNKIDALFEITRYVGLALSFALIGLLVFGLFCTWKASR